MNFYMNIAIEKSFIWLFCFFGPIGNLIPILPFIEAFRFYYFILAVGVIYFFINYKKNIHAIKTMLYSFPVFCILCLSALFSYMQLSNINIEAENPIIRFLLLCMLWSFTIFIGNKVRNLSNEENTKYILVYLTGYIVSMLFGYMFHFGFYMGEIGIETIEKFEVLTQMGYGILRFSPGSYPNEYGIVSSFTLSIFTLLLYKRTSLIGMGVYAHKKFLLCIYLLTLIALFLTTTRAAYVAYIFSLIYIFSKMENWIKKVKMILILLMLGITFIFITQNSMYDVIGILEAGYNSLTEQDSSAYVRIIAWETAYDEFLEQWFWGIGFGQAAQIHNVYLQFLFELGIGGSLILEIYALSGIYISFQKLKKSRDMFIHQVFVIGIIHILWFAMSNHNLNHHMTWFVVLLYYMVSTKDEVMVLQKT